MTWQPPAALHPDIETILPAIIRDGLATRTEAYAQGVKVGRRRESTWTASAVVVRRDGGASDGILDRPRVAVRVWADAEDDATDLALLVRSLILSAPPRRGLVKAESLSGPYAVDDDSGPQRYMLLEVTTSGQPL